MSDYKGFPVELLPDPVARFVRETSTAIGCDAAMVALPALSALGSAIGTTRAIQLKSGWTEPPVIWSCVIARSGTMKSPAHDAALSPLREAQDRRFREHEAANARHERAMLDYERALAAWRKSKLGDPPHSVWSAYSDTPTDGQPWNPVRVEPIPDWSGPDYEGWGKTPVVLDDGRIVVVNTDRKPEDGGFYNKNLPYVVYSDDGGLDWKPDQLPPVLVADAEASGIVATQIEYHGPVGDTPQLVDRRKCAPAIAVDRGHPQENEVYVAFYARATEDDDLTQDRNTDIYISRSSDRGRTFPIDPFHLFQLSDLLLTGQAGGLVGPDQLMPAVAIDGCGGVNLVFYDTRNDPNYEDDEYWLDLYYVRIVGVAEGAPVVQHQARLTPQSFKLAGSFLGDYQHFAAAGADQKTLYAAYVATALDGSGEWTEHNCYLHKVQVFCAGGLGFGEGGGSDDVARFLDSYEACQLHADVSGNGVVDEEDLKMFWDAYEESCGGP